MLLFYCARRSELSAIGIRGLPQRRRRQYRLWTSLSSARHEGGSCVVAIDPATEGSWLPSAIQSAFIDVDSVDRRWIVNVGPYRRAKPVTAAGGILTRHRDDRCQVLSIYRRGHWDLPKGKRDSGESITECALREVKEEIGIGEVRIVQPLGTTVHGYVQESRYMVKTTHWFEMRTSEVGFTPQHEEGIDRVSWMTVEEAIGHLGYSTLRTLLRTRKKLLCATREWA
jgi:8-oxo-dGTP pyrophosphatase MutT (NUDIX family)